MLWSSGALLWAALGAETLGGGGGDDDDLRQQRTDLGWRQHTDLGWRRRMDMGGGGQDRTSSTE